MKEQRPGGGGTPALTPAELRILTLVAEYWSCREIARYLSLSEKTVENRRCGIIQKFQLRGHRGLVNFALEWAAERNTTQMELPSPWPGPKIPVGPVPPVRHDRDRGYCGELCVPRDHSR